MRAFVNWFRRDLDGDSSSEGRRAAAEASDVVFASMQAVSETQFFGKRGFSAATVQILIDAGIVLPEELLFLPMDYIKGLSGLQPAGLTEIRNYRRRFPPPREELPAQHPLLSQENLDRTSADATMTSLPIGDLMTTRTTSKTVIFAQPFVLNEGDGEQLPGIYTVETEEESLDLVSVTATRRISTVMHGHASGYVDVDPNALAAALARDVRTDN